MRTAFPILVLAALLPAQTARDRLAAMLPDAPAFGARPQGPAEFYAADLYKYLDGGAEAYHKRGFVALVHREFKAGEIDLTADIYDMGSSANAYGIFSTERSPRCRDVRIGREGYTSEGILNFVQGRYYVKLMAFGDASRTAALLEAAAKSASARIKE